MFNIFELRNVFLGAVFGNTDNFPLKVSYARPVPISPYPVNHLLHDYKKAFD